MKQKNEHLKLVKKKKSLPGWKRALRFLFRLTLILAVLALVRHGEAYFRVAEIRVEGNLELSAAEIVSAGGIKKGMSIFLLREQQVAGRIREQYPRVKDIKIGRNLPDMVTIIVTEREPVGYVLTADGFWLIDNEAVCFAYMAEPANEYPLISGIDGGLVIPGAPLACPVREESLQAFFSNRLGVDPLHIEKLDLSDRYNLVVHTAEGLEIWLGDGKDMEQKLLLVRESIPYIDSGAEKRLDVRAGNRLVVSSSAVLDAEEVEP